MSIAYQPRTLREWLFLTHTSQRQLARDIGVHQSMISMMTRGTRAARGPLAIKLHNHTGVPFEALLQPAQPQRPRRRRRIRGGAKKR